MSITFKEYIEESDNQGKKKLQEILDLLKRVKGFDVFSFLKRDKNPYIYVKIKLDKEYNKILENLKLGIRIYYINNAITYRLQQGPKGYPIGPAKKLEEEKEIEDLMMKGKDGNQVLNEIIKKIPNKLRDFLKKVADQIKNSQSNYDDTESDNEKYKRILNSILTGDYDRTLKL